MPEAGFALDTAPVRRVHEEQSTLCGRLPLTERAPTQGGLLL